MPPEKPERFDQVDWTEYANPTGWQRSTNTRYFLYSTVPVLALGLYDWLVVGPREATFVRLGADLGLSGPFQMIGLTHDPAGIDYLFVGTLLLFVWYLLVPLYQNPRMTRYYWTRFKRNRPALGGLGWLFLVFAGGLIGPFVLNTPSQDILTAHQPPAFTSVDEATVPLCVGEVENGRCYGTWEHPLGTDNTGRDVFSSIIHGMTISMQIAFITTAVVAVIGVSVGTVAAVSGGWVDEGLMRVVDIVLSFPTLPFYLLILYSFGASLSMFILVFALFAWGGTARYVRSKALSVSEAEYINESRLSGASTSYIIRRHVIPNTASSIITQLTLLIPVFLLAEAQIAFLGLGDSDVPSWGQLIAAGRTDLAFAPWIVLAPGIALFLTILAFTFVGDALLDALDPEAKTEADR